MRHARDQDLDRVEDLLAQLRALPGLTEKKRGVFYRKSRAFLHFHEDPKGMFADISDPDERIDVTEAAGQAALMAAARPASARLPARPRPRAFPRRGRRCPSPWLPRRS